MVVNFEHCYEVTFVQQYKSFCMFHVGKVSGEESAPHLHPETERISRPSCNWQGDLGNYNVYFNHFHQDNNEVSNVCGLSTTCLSIEV